MATELTREQRAQNEIARIERDRRTLARVERECEHLQGTDWEREVRRLAIEGGIKERHIDEYLGDRD